jgi:hypothetical protein
LNGLLLAVNYYDTFGSDIALAQPVVVHINLAFFTAVARIRISIIAGLTWSYPPKVSTIAQQDLPATHQSIHLPTELMMFDILGSCSSTFKLKSTACAQVKAHLGSGVHRHKLMLAETS